MPYADENESDDDENESDNDNSSKGSRGGKDDGLPDYDYEQMRGAFDEGGNGDITKWKWSWDPSAPVGSKLKKAVGS